MEKDGVLNRLTDKVSCPPLAGQLDCRVSGRVENDTSQTADAMKNRARSRMWTHGDGQKSFEN